MGFRRARRPAGGSGVGEMTAKKGLLIGCSVSAVVGLVVAVLVVTWLRHVGQDPEGLWLSAEAPAEVRAGETFALVVRVSNRREAGAVELGDLDIDDSYLRGFTLLAESPESRSTIIDDFNDCTTFNFDTVVGAGETAEFRFELRAEHVGRHRGEIDQYAGMQFVTTVVQTTVTR
jgi:hypothetical protein